MFLIESLWTYHEGMVDSCRRKPIYSLSLVLASLIRVIGRFLLEKIRTVFKRKFQYLIVSPNNQQPTTNDNQPTTTNQRQPIHSLTVEIPQQIIPRGSHQLRHDGRESKRAYLVFLGSQLPFQRKFSVNYREKKNFLHGKER